MMRASSQVLLSICLLGCLLVAPVLAAPQRPTPKPKNRNVLYREKMEEAKKLVARKKLAPAATAYETARKMFPNLPEPIWALSDLARREKDWDRARELDLEAFALRQQYKATARLMEYVRRDMKAGEHEKALEILEMLYEARPDDLNIIDSLVACLNKAGRTEEAIEAGESGVELFVDFFAKNPDKKPYGRAFLQELATAWLKADRFDEAADRQSNLLKVQPSEARRLSVGLFYLKAGRESLDAGELDPALAYLEKAMEIRPEDIQANRDLARVLWRRGENERALAHLDRAQQRMPGNPFLLQDLAVGLLREGRHSRAQVLFEELVRLQPGNAKHAENLVEALLAQQKRDQAEETFHAVLARIEETKLAQDRKRELVEKLCERFQGQFDLSDIEAARLDEIQTALCEHPDDPEEYRRLGEYHLSRGETRLALAAHLQAACLSGKGEALVARTLGLMKQPQGNTPFLFVQAVLEHFPANPQVFEILERYSGIGRGGLGRRFALEPEEEARYALAAETCRRLRDDESVDPILRRRARFEEMRYRLEPTASRPEIWTQARDEAIRLLSDKELPSDLRVRILDWLANVEDQRLHDPHAAFAWIEKVVQLDPNPRALNRLVLAAIRTRPLPQPVVLEEYVEKNANDPQSVRLEILLAEWLWELGRRDEAVERLRHALGPWSDGRKTRAAEGARREAERRHPELLRAAEPPGENPENTGRIELVHERVWRTGADSLGADGLAMVGERTRLSLPAEWRGATVRVRTDERPCVTEPPLFFAALESDPDGLAWEAVWRQKKTDEPGADSPTLVMH
ncbi:tetratricopeptide repeat protein, partial [bacterium]|nr:tetratricopeptide repeat protein [bacterium]